MPATADFAPVRFEFSTHALPAKKRLPFWRDAFMRQVVHTDVHPRSEKSFRAHAVVQAMPDLRITSFQSAAASLTRSSEMIADGDDDVVLLTPSAGRLYVVQRGRETTLQPGDALLLRHAEPAALIHDDVRFQGFIFPRAVLGTRVRNLESVMMCAIPCSAEPLRLLVNYVDLVVKRADLGSPALGRSVVNHIHDLAALALGASRDTRNYESSAVVAARLAAALAYIDESFDEAGLRLESVARRLSVSPRYVQRLLEASGTSFTARVNELRLRKAFALLTEQDGRYRRISDIAMDAGFSDVSHFNRLFRARFGDTPTGIRGNRC